MVRLFLWCVVIGCCLCISQASADDDKVLSGPGARTCEEFAFDYRVNRDTENTYFDWAEGFISGMNWIDAMTDHTAKNIMAFWCINRVKDGGGNGRTYFVKPIRWR